MVDWKPGMPSVRAAKDPKAAALAAFDQMDADEKAAFIQQLREKAEG